MTTSPSSDAAAVQAAAPPPPPRSSPFVALQHRNFRLLWGGQLASFSGSMMQTAAILWHVSLLVPGDRKALALGLVGLIRVVPIMVFSVLAGVVADALDRRKLMMLTQSAMAVIAVLLAVLTFRGLSEVWPIYLLAALSSAASSFDAPARQSLIPNLVPREHLANAISLNAIMLQIASVVGPSVGGLIIAQAGVGWVYVVNAMSFVFVIGALAMMRDVRASRAEPGTVSLRAMIEGLRFVFSAPLIRSTMLLDFFATLFSSATALLPIFAQDILQVGARGYGWLYAAPSVGALVTSAAMVRLVEIVKRRGVVLLCAVFTYGMATVMFGMSRVFWLTFIALALTGAADTVSMVFRNIVRHMETPDHLRGRMVGVNMVFFMGGPQLGELEAGLVANWFGAPFSVISGGLACGLATLIVAFRTPALRRYRA
ncbi:MAG TPA: MFS transporter [Vicinamibacterales bacterium]